MRADWAGGMGALKIRVVWFRVASCELRVSRCGFDWDCFVGGLRSLDFYNALSKLNLGAFWTSGILPLFGFVFAASEAAIHFPNPLSQFNLGAFRTPRKLGLFVQVGIFRVSGCGLRVSSCGLRAVWFI